MSWFLVMVVKVLTHTAVPQLRSMRSGSISTASMRATTGCAAWPGAGAGAWYTTAGMATSSLTSGLPASACTTQL